MFPPTRYVRGGALRAHKRDDLYQLLTKLKFGLPDCIVWFSTIHPAQLYGGWFLDIFFQLSVWSPCKKKTKIAPTNYTKSKVTGQWKRERMATIFPDINKVQISASTFEDQTDFAGVRCVLTGTDFRVPTN